MRVLSLSARRFALGLTLLASLSAGLVRAQPSSGRASAVQSVPTPEQALGFRPGADYKLADYAMIVDYYCKLAAAAPDRIHVVEIGPTAQGHKMILAIISSRENMRQLDLSLAKIQNAFEMNSMRGGL